jgi:fused signal recognition particle receptor
VFKILKKKLSKIVEKIAKKTEEAKEELKEEKVEVKKPGVIEKIFKKIKVKKLSEADLKQILDEFVVDLIESDVALEVAEKIADDLKKELVGREIKRGKEKEVITNALRKSLLNILSVPRIDLEKIVKKAKSENRPAVLLFFGVNGVGKSLNLSKVALWLKNRGYKPILGAGDTFRAAGDIQLEEYAKKINLPVVKHKPGGDPAAVIFDARKSAEARGYDVVLGDTSGRMHVQKNLMDELAKIVRVNKPDLKILVLDSLTGSDVIPQFEFFDKAIGVDAVIFSKNDVNEKGGNILSICYRFKRPILFLGIGQKMEDLIPYEPEKFVDSLIR